MSTATAQEVTAPKAKKKAVKQKDGGSHEFSGSKVNYDNLKKVRAQIRAYDHPLRNKILNYIDKNPKTDVRSVYVKLKMEQSVASQQLGILRDAGLVTATRNGKNVNYEVNHDAVNQLNERVA